MLEAIVIGSPGAGKSTFARKLRDITKLPLYYLDLMWHKPDCTHISREEFDAQVRELVKKDRWIIDFPEKQLPDICRLLRSCENEKNVIIFRSREEADAYLNAFV